MSVPPVPVAPADHGSPADEHAAFAVEFPSAPGPNRAASRLPLQKFYDVNVTVSVELGQVSMPIGELLHLGEGAIVELTRSISEPVDIMAQGVRLARGEVVVVDDRYGIRITQIETDSAATVARRD